MNNLTIIGIIAVAALLVYLLGFFVFSRLFIPNLGFKKEKLPKRIPKEIMLAIQKIKRKSKSKNDFLKKSYAFLTRRYQGKRNTILKKPWLLFETNLKRIWKKKGFIPCHTFTYLLRLFLVKSKMFKDKEIKIHHTFLNFCIHQYLSVKIKKKKWIPVDAWGKAIGIKFGKHTPYFK